MECHPCCCAVLYNGNMTQNFCICSAHGPVCGGGTCAKSAFELILHTFWGPNGFRWKKQKVWVSQKFRCSYSTPWLFDFFLTRALFLERCWPLFFWVAFLLKIRICTSIQKCSLRLVKRLADFCYQQMWPLKSFKLWFMKPGDQVEQMKLKRANMDRFKSEMESKDEKNDSHFQLWKLIQKSNLRHIQWCTGPLSNSLLKRKCSGFWWKSGSTSEFTGHSEKTNFDDDDDDDDDNEDDDRDISLLLQLLVPRVSERRFDHAPPFSEIKSCILGWKPTPCDKDGEYLCVKTRFTNGTYSEGVVLFQMILHASSVPISQIVRKRSVHRRAHSAYWWASVWWSRRRSCCREVLRRLTWPCFWRWVAMSWEMKHGPCLFRVYRGLY